jgi:16S rRNA (adenine1518-N6/adenine1519-N6)-dimethyltransferase
VTAAGRHGSLLAGTKALLAAHGLAPRKARGQHFLIDARVRDRIVEAAGVGPGSTVLEVGPGTGTLTEALLLAGASVLAVELDRGLARLLQERLGGHPGLTVWVDDALRLDLAARLGGHPDRGNIRVVANIPYYITTPLILRFLQHAELFRALVLTVQREVADRLTASPGGKAYGALTVACRYRADAQAVLRIPCGAFHPAPEVESRLVRLDLLPRPRIETADPGHLFHVVRAAFGQRRKTLRNALRQAGWPAAQVETALAAAAIAGSRRGETLSLEEFGGLAAALPAGEPGAESREPSPEALQGGYEDTQ